MCINRHVRLQDKTKQVGFEWDDVAQVKEKVDEEIQELYSAVATGQQNKIEDEFGDVLFALVNYARYLDVDPENALERTNKKFIKRFSYIETKAKEAGKDLQHMTLEEMDELWNQAKQSE